MVVALIVVGWLLSLLGALAVGFRWSKNVSYHTTLRAEAARRVRIGSVFVRATVAVLVPAYGRRWDRKREEARRAYVDRLVPIENRFTGQG